MAKQSKPAIRFKGFTDAWEQRKLGALCVEFKSGDFISASDIAENEAYPVYGGNGLRGFTNHYNHDGEYALIGRQGALCGNVNYAVGKSYFTEHAVAVRANKTNQTRFLYYLFSTMNLGQYSGQSAQPGLAVGNLVELENVVPSKPEQEKIASFLSSLDNLITLHQRKYDKLQVLKKAMLEKMFPKNGSSVPEIRFKGFTDAWEQRKLGEVANLLTGFPFESKKFVREGIKLVRGMNVKRGYLDFSEELCECWSSSQGLENYLLNSGDILIQMDGALIGKSYAKIKENQLPALLVQRVTRVRIQNQISDGSFVYQQIQKGFLTYIKGTKTETAVPHLSLNDIESFEIATPSVDEEKKIGAFFESLDHLITLHQRELEKLQNIKKSMLEKMFV